MVETGAPSSRAASRVIRSKLSLGGVSSSARFRSAFCRTSSFSIMKRSIRYEYPTAAPLAKSFARNIYGHQRYTDHPIKTGRALTCLFSGDNKAVHHFLRSCLIEGDLKLVGVDGRYCAVAEFLVENTCAGLERRRWAGARLDLE